MPPKKSRLLIVQSPFTGLSAFDVFEQRLNRRVWTRLSGLRLTDFLNAAPAGLAYDPIAA
jgi:hypothetical protein